MEVPVNPECPGCQALSKRLSQLEGQVAELTRKLDRGRHTWSSLVPEADPFAFSRSRVFTLEQLQEKRDLFDDRLNKLLKPTRTVPAHETFAMHLWKHFEQWFTFLFNPEVEATNWKAEQAIRPAVVNRKVWGGNRTEAGAEAQGIIMSVLETCRRKTKSALDHISSTLRWVASSAGPRPVLMAG